MLVLVMMVVSQVKAGPLDAFRLNQANINCRIEFTCRAGTIGRNEITEGKLWTPGDHVLAEDKAHRVTGSWESDGLLQHTICLPAPEPAKERPTPKAGEGIAGQLAIDLITDAQTTAFHHFTKKYLIELTDERAPGWLSHGPFYFGLKKFPESIEESYHGVIPTSATGTKGTYPCDIQIYRKNNPTYWVQREVSYDPSIGYLPRFIRDLVVTIKLKNGRGGKAMISETFIADARPTDGGGFVPTESYRCLYAVNDFEERYPQYSHKATITPDDRTVSCQEFKVSKFATRSKLNPIQFTGLEGVVGVAGPGGFVALGMPPKTLSLGELKSMLGSKLARRERKPIRSIDHAELHEFDHVATPFRIRYVVGGLVACAIVSATLLLMRRRSRAQALLMLAMLCLQGCGTDRRPVARLDAEFTTSRFTYEANEGVLPVRLHDSVSLIR